jgi:hypothetical protein
MCSRASWTAKPVMCDAIPTKHVVTILQEQIWQPQTISANKVHSFMCSINYSVCHAGMWGVEVQISMPCENVGSRGTDQYAMRECGK